MSETLSTIEKALFLKELDVFRDVNVEQVAEVAAVAEEMQIEPGESIIRPEDPSEHVYVVIDGHVIIERDGIVTLVVTPMRGFGDFSFAPEGNYGYSARAADDVHLLRVARDDFIEMMLEHPEIAVGVVRALGVRLREAMQQLAALGRHVQDGTNTEPAEEPR